MPSDFAFRLATHLTLALACLCLGYAEWDLLKEGSLLAAVVIVLLGVSFWAEGRYVLDLGAANRVGFAIAVVAVVWLGYQFLNRSSLIYTFPWPASLLPYLGPVLMVLMPAKLFRPKHVGDWWAMQGIALAGAGLAASMAEDELFGVLLGLYVIAAVSSLSLFFLRRAAGGVEPLPRTQAGPAPALYADPQAGSRRVVRRAVGWLVVAVGLAFPFFLITPRSGAPRWTFGNSRLDIGYSSDEMIDLNRTGELRANREVALVVTAKYPDGRPKEDLDTGTRWRGAGFRLYERGQWTRPPLNPLSDWTTSGGDGAVQFDAPVPPPDLGPNQVILTFAPRVSLPDAVLADPVRWAAGQAGPAVNEGGAYRPWLQRGDGSFFGLPPSTGIKHRYRQVYAPPADPDDDRGTPFRMPAPSADSDRAEAYRTVSDSLRQLAKWSRDLLDKLVESGRIPAAVLARMDRDQRRVHPGDYEAVAKAFGTYFRTSGEYEYTLKLKKTDRGADPIEDFLLKTKAGHCQRFAAALTLAVRSVGVPAQYVLGFKGCEYDGNGDYVIRQDNAHAWVEVLVPHPPSLQPDCKPTRWQWLAIDPTPDGSSEGDSTSWFGSARETGAALFFEFIIGYNAERRRRAVIAVENWISANTWLIGGCGCLVVLVAGRRLFRSPTTLADRRRRVSDGSGGWLARRYGVGWGRSGRADRDTAPWYGELLRLLARHGYTVPTGSTPREFAAVVAKELGRHERTSGVIELPARVTAAFYRTRYAGERLSAADLDLIAADLRTLTAGLGRPAR